MQVNGISSQLFAPPPGTPSSGILGRDDFFKLLVLQLQNQDPLNPIQDREFIAQMAQLSQLDVVRETNDKIDGVSLASQANQALQMIGRDVTFQRGEDSPGVGTVTGVKIGGDQPLLLIGGREVPVSDVLVVE